MALNRVTLTGTYLDGEGNALSGSLKFVPNTQLADATDSEIIRQSPITVTLSAQGTFSVQLYATDNTHLLPSGWVWNATEYITGLPANAYSFFLAFTNGATQDISALATITDAPQTSQYVPSSEVGQPSGVAALNSSGYVPLTQGGTGAGSASTALTALGAASAAALTAETSRAGAAEGALLPLAGGTMSGAIAMGSHKVTGLANGTVATDAAAFGQIAPILTPTAVKTSNYTAAAGDMVKTDTSGGSLTVTLPTAPAVNTTIGVKQVTVAGLGTNATTVAAGGSDVFNKSGGPASFTLDRLNQTVVLQYGSGAIWTVISTDPATGQIATARQGIYYLDTFTGTDDAKMAAALAAVFAASPAGGTIVLSPRAHTFASQWSTSYSAGVTTTVKITGAGVAFNGAWGTVSGATTATFTYSGAGAACMDFQHIGTIELSGIQFKSANTGVPLFQTTNATPDLHDCVWSGGGTGTGCITDAIVLGGTSTTVGSGDTAKYNAYQGQIFRNFFDGVRRIALLNVASNSVLIYGNTVSTSCGSGLFLGACIELAGTASRTVVGVQVYGNCIEMSNYPVAIKGTYAIECTLGPNGFFDPTGTTIAHICLDPNSTYNEVIDGYRNDSFPLVYDLSGLAGIRTAHQSQKSLWRQPQVSISAVASAYLSPDQGSPRFQDNSGNWAGLTTGSDTAGTYALCRLVSSPCTVVTDGATYIASQIVTSLTAAWVTADILEPVSGTGIPGRAFIEWVFTPSTAFPWQASTAYSLGDVTRPASSNGHLYQCTTAGTTGSSAPAFPTGGGTVTDGTAVWTDLGTAATAALISSAATATGTALTLSFGRAGTQMVHAYFSRHHMVTQGSAPSSAATSGWGSGATISTTGTDMACVVTLTAGTTPSAAPVLTVTASTTWGGKPTFQMSAGSTAAAALIAGGWFWTSTNGGTATITFTGTPAASVAHVFAITAVQ